MALLPEHPVVVITVISFSHCCRSCDINQTVMLVKTFLRGPFIKDVRTKGGRRGVSRKADIVREFA